MQLQTLIINKLNETIRVLLNKNNIVDFKNNDKTKLVSLDDMLTIIPNLKLANKTKKGRLILFSNNKTSIKTSYFDEANLIFSVNLKSLFSNNNLQELISEYYDNHCSNIVNFVNKQLTIHKDILNEPDVTKNFEDLLMDIQNLAKNTKNKKIDFFATQIPNFQKRFESLQDFEKKKINKFFKTQMIQESSNFVKILTQDSQIDKAIDILTKKLSKITSYKTILKMLHRHKKQVIATTILRVKDNPISINFSLNIKDDTQAFSYLDIGAIDVYINNVINFGAIDTESDLREFIKQFLYEELGSYKKAATRRFIGSLIVHEIQHKLNPMVDKVSKDKINFKKKRLSKLLGVDVEKLEQEDKEEQLDYSLDPTEIQARMAQMTYYLVSKFESLPKFRQRLKTLPQLFMSIPSGMLYQVDEVDPKIKNKIFREVYKLLKEKGYK